MHPRGVQFGLSHGLLQLRGSEVLLSNALLEMLSLEAQVWIHMRRRPIDGNFLVELTVRAAEEKLGNDYAAKRQDVLPFFAGLNRVMYYTLCRVAEQAGVARKEPTRLITDEEFWREFTERSLDINFKPKRGIPGIQRALFKVCREIVTRRYAVADPENSRHADLVALFMFNFWNATGLLPMTQSFVILGSQL